MTPLREAFCELLSQYPGEDATEYMGWARSEDPVDARQLAKYVRDFIGSFNRYDLRDHENRPWVPIFQALLDELTTGKVVVDARALAKLHSERKRATCLLRAAPLVEAVLKAVGLDAHPSDEKRAEEAVADLIGGWL